MTTNIPCFDNFFNNFQSWLREFNYYPPIHNNVDNTYTAAQESRTTIYGFFDGAQYRRKPTATGPLGGSMQYSFRTSGAVELNGVIEEITEDNQSGDTYIIVDVQPTNNEVGFMTAICEKKEMNKSDTNRIQIVEP